MMKLQCKVFFLLNLSVLCIMLATACTTRKCLECECRRSSLVGCTNPYGTSARYQDFCDGEDGVSADDFCAIEERMNDDEWLCINTR